MSKTAKREISGISIATETETGDGGRPNSELVSRYAGDRSRIGAATPAATYQIERRDLAKRFCIDPLRRSYRVIPILELLSEQEKERFMRSGRAWQKRVAPEPRPDARELRILHRYEQTGDEKVLFHCSARRWITTRRSERDPAYGTIWDESVADEWYLDSEEVEERYPGYSRRLVHRGFVIAKSSNERVIFDHAGERPRGFCVHSFTVQKHHAELRDGTFRENSSSFTTRVVSITREVLSESDFEPPAGFRQLPMYPGRFAMMHADLTRSLRSFGSRFVQGVR